MDSYTSFTIAELESVHPDYPEAAYTQSTTSIPVDLDSSEDGS